MDKQMNVLLVEDNPGDARIVELLFQELIHLNAKVSIAETLAQAIARLEGKDIDLVLLDLGLPDAQHFSGLSTILEDYPRIPVVVLTGADDAELGIYALRHGAQDYLSKSNLDTQSLYKAVRYSVERVQNEQARLASEAEYAAAFKSAASGMAVLDLEARFTKVNQATCKIFGHPEEALLQAKILDFADPEMEEQLIKNLDLMCKGELDNHLAEYFFAAIYDVRVYVLLSACLIRDNDNKPSHLVLQLVDMTERKEAEIKLLQSQKLEAVGQLTGGIAHDFNNLLGIIMGNLEMLQLSQNIGDEENRRIESALDASNRGAELTNRLLAFSRQQSLTPKLSYINHSIDNMLDILMITLGETIELKVEEDKDLWPALIDASQLETAILNLAVNARDAMAHGGKLLIQSTNVFVESARPDSGIPAGEYAKLAIIDNGEGMPKAIQNKVLQPFFTTKEIGKGSGLGLSMVFGFVKQSGGHLHIQSEEHKGTAIELYFPRPDTEGVKLHNVEKIEKNVIDGKETILVVEDNPGVLNIVVDQLNSLGYKTLEAETAKEGLELLEQQSDEIDLVFSDIKLPGGMSGIEMSEQVHQKYPAQPVLLTSGFSEQFANEDFQKKETSILQKPYSREQLSHEIRLALDKSR